MSSPVAGFAPESASAGASDRAQPAWPMAGRVAFRWFCTYILLYCFPFPFSSLPGVLGKPGEWWQHAVDSLLPWVGRTAFGIPAVATGFPTGSGDTQADYLRSFLFAAVATVVTIVWTAAEGRRRAHRRIAIWTLSYVRYTLAAALMSYGVAKVIPQQMPMPNAVRMTEMFGELSPMGLAWAFTGFSAPYEIFGGLMELLPGVLLVFRRTALLGAMLAVPVMVNVVLLNFSYDVPVKLYSSHLLLMAIAVIAPNLHRLYGVLVKNCPVAPGDLTPPVRRGWPRVLRGIWKSLVLGFAGFRLYGAAANPPSRDIVPPDAPGTVGAWSVLSFSGSGVNALPWRNVSLSEGRSTIRLANDSLLMLQTTRDSAKATLTLVPIGEGMARDTANAIRATYQVRGEQTVNGVQMRRGDTLSLSGTRGGDPFNVVLLRRDLTKMRLVSRGFHWVQEYPYNR